MFLKKTLVRLSELGTRLAAFAGVVLFQNCFRDQAFEKLIQEGTCFHEFFPGSLLMGLIERLPARILEMLRVLNDHCSFCEALARSLKIQMGRVVAGIHQDSMQGNNNVESGAREK